MIAGTSKLRRVISLDDERKVANDGLLTADVRGNPSEFVKLYRRHYDAVFRYCIHRLFDRQTAEDITADVFLKVVENFHRFRGGEKQFRNWLYIIATNAVNDHLRRTARRDGLLKGVCRQIDSQYADCQSPEVQPAEKLTLLREAVLSLKPRYQTIITLRFFENLKLTEIAEVLGSSPGTVRSQLRRALAKLRKVLAIDLM